MIGFGSYRLRGDEAKKCVFQALELGYRLIDTAAAYKNEKEIGEIIRDYCTEAVPRDKLIITSKLSAKDHGSIRTYDAALKSINLLNVDYLDYYLIHWPGKASLRADDPRNSQYRKESWRALELLHDDGKIRNLGISNYTQRHLEELLHYARIRPTILQIEFHPLVFDEEIKNILKLCQNEGITVQAYSSFGEGILLKEPKNGTDTDLCLRELQNLAEHLGVTRAQLLLRWATDKGVWVIPKSSSAKHMEQNINLDFSLPQNVRNAMDTMCRRYGRHKFCWDPSVVH